MQGLRSFYTYKSVQADDSIIIMFAINIILTVSTYY